MDGLAQLLRQPGLLAAWIVGAAVLLGVVLGGFYLAGRPIRGPARAASILHGVLAATGTVLAAASVGVNLATAMLLLALLGGGIVVLAQLRRRRPPGLAVMLHATLGAAGAVLLAAAFSGR